MSLDVHKRMVARLLATSSVTTLLGSNYAKRIKPLRRMQATSLPAVVYSQVGGTASNVSTGTSKTGSSRFRVHCLDDSYDGARALSEAIDGAMSGWSDTGSGVWHRAMGPIDGPEEILPGQDAAEFSVVQDYSVWHSTT